MAMQAASWAVPVPEATADPMVVPPVGTMSMPAPMPYGMGRDMTNDMGGVVAMMVAAGICGARYANRHNSGHNEEKNAHVPYLLFCVSSVCAI